MVSSQPVLAAELSSALPASLEVIVVDLLHDDPSAGRQTRAATTSVDQQLPPPCLSDASHERAISRLAEDLAADGRTVVGIVNITGRAVERIVADTDLDLWTEQLESTLYPTVSSCQHLLPLLLHRRRGVLLNVISDLAMRPAPGLSALAAHHAAVLSLTRSLAEPCAQRGVTVRALALESWPGVSTPDADEGPTGPVQPSLGPELVLTAPLPLGGAELVRRFVTEATAPGSHGLLPADPRSGLPATTPRSAPRQESPSP